MLQPHAPPAGEGLTEIHQRSPGLPASSGLGGTKQCSSSNVPVVSEGQGEMHQRSPALPASSGLGGPHAHSLVYSPHISPAPLAREGLTEMDQWSPGLPASSGLGGSSTRALATTPPAATNQDQTRRPTRERKQRQLYDASTGKYIAPCAVSEEFT